MSISPAPVSVTELQGALRAAWAGQFRPGAERGRKLVRLPASLDDGALAGRVVMVVGCHGGAGASTVALSVADAAGESGRSARLLDCASAECSGLLTAVDAELGVERGWRRGRRARLPIDRVAGVLAWVGDVPAPIDGSLAPAQVTVLDTGWGATAVLSGDSWLAQAAGSAAVVLVARATIPALRRLEQVLATCPPGPVVAVRGPARWDRSVRATAGPALLAAEAAGRVVRVPADRHLGASGITCVPLPKAAAESGRQIFARVLAAYPQTPAALERLGPSVTNPSRNGLWT